MPPVPPWEAWGGLDRAGDEDGDWLGTALGEPLGLADGPELGVEGLEVGVLGVPTVKVCLGFRLIQ